MKEKVFCSYANKLCKHCSDNKILCNEVEREGISYLDCRYATMETKTTRLDYMIRIINSAYSIQADLSGNADSRNIGENYIMIEKNRVEELLNALDEFDKYLKQANEPYFEA